MTFYTKRGISHRDDISTVTYQELEKQTKNNISYYIVRRMSRIICCGTSENSSLFSELFIRQVIFIIEKNETVGTKIEPITK